MRNDPRPLISVQQHSTAIRAQYPSDVVNRRLRIAEMLYHPLAPDEIDARVVERQRAGQSIDERHIRYAAVFRSTRGDGPQTRIGLNTGNPARWSVSRGLRRDQPGQAPAHCSGAAAE